MTLPCAAAEPGDASSLCASVATRLGAERVSLWRRCEDDAARLILRASWPADGLVGALPNAARVGAGGAASVATGRSGDGVWSVPVDVGGITGEVVVSPAPSDALAIEAAQELARLAAVLGGPAGVVREVVQCEVTMSAVMEATEGRRDIKVILSRIRDRFTLADSPAHVDVLIMLTDHLTSVLTTRTDGEHGADGATSGDVFGPAQLAQSVVDGGGVVVEGCPGAPRCNGCWLHGGRRAVGLPLHREGRLLGVMVLDLPPGYAVGGQESRVLVENGDLVAAAIDRLRMEMVQRHRLAVSIAQRSLLEAGVRASSVLEASEAIARSMADALDVPMSCTYLVDRENYITELASVGTSGAQQAELRRRLIGKQASDSPVWKLSIAVPEPGPYLLDDSRPPASTRPGGGMAQILGYQCLAAIPLLASEGPIGVVVCGDDQSPRQWRDDERVMAAELAMQATVVLDNARLREADRHRAVHDGLTGLLNRAGLQERLDQEMARSRRGDLPLVVMVLDLNRFKEVNDSMGHEQGDVLLVQVADRLRVGVREHDVVARIGGDEFAVLLPATEIGGAVRSAARIEELLTSPMSLAGRLVQVGASIGIAAYPDHGRTAADLVRNADIAMYVSKRSAVPYSVYQVGPGHAEAMSKLETTTVLGDLGRALASDELVLHFQPKVRIGSGEVHGVEALVRWQHPQRGLVGPDQFVPLAERGGLIRRLTAWAIPQALRHCRQWLDDGLDLTVAVNVSAHDLTDPHFVDRVRGALDGAGVDSSHLIVELTETALLRDVTGGMQTLTRLRGIGVRCSLDDFGTGYSALSYLSSMPIDELKIDRSFFADAIDERSGAVLESMIQLAHRLGLSVVAEGVETHSLSESLGRLGVDEIQGFVYSRPLPAGQLVAWLRARTWVPTGRPVPVR